MRSMGTVSLALELLAGYVSLAPHLLSDGNTAGASASGITDADTKWLCELAFRGHQVLATALLMALLAASVALQPCWACRGRRPPAARWYAAVSLLAAAVAILQLVGAALLWQGLEPEDYSAVVTTAMVLACRVAGAFGGWKWRSHETREQRRVREISTFLRRRGVELPEEAYRVQAEVSQ